MFFDRSDLMRYNKKMTIQPDLPLLRLQLTFRADEDLKHLPEFRGAFWRSVFGCGLRRLSDPTRPLSEVWPTTVTTVSTGALQREDLYNTVFAPEDENDILPRHIKSPAPYVIDSPSGPRTIPAGGVETIGLTLIGDRVVASVPAILAAFASAAEHGLGSADKTGHRGRATLVSAEIAWRAPGDCRPVLLPTGEVAPVAAEVPPVPDCPSAVEITLATPLRLVRAGRLLGVRRLTAGDLIEALIRRVSILQRTLGFAPLAIDFRTLFALGHEARMREADLVFADQQRWSSHQGQEINMGGVLGSFRLPLVGLEPLWPFLWFGQFVHAGKGAAMGLGAVRLT